jgi:hypothetical protein
MLLESVEFWSQNFVLSFKFTAQQPQPVKLVT